MIKINIRKIAFSLSLAAFFLFSLLFLILLLKDPYPEQTRFNKEKIINKAFRGGKG